MYNVRPMQSWAFNGMWTECDLSSSIYCSGMELYLFKVVVSIGNINLLGILTYLHI
jgi:hypothetical protein